MVAVVIKSGIFLKLKLQKKGLAKLKIANKKNILKSRMITVMVAVVIKGGNILKNWHYGKIINSTKDIF